MRSNGRQTNKFKLRITQYSINTRETKFGQSSIKMKSHTLFWLALVPESMVFSKSTRLSGLFFLLKQQK